jgi:hypothetical protein
MNLFLACLIALAILYVIGQFLPLASSAELKTP